MLIFYMVVKSKGVTDRRWEDRDSRKESWGCRCPGLTDGGGQGHWLRQNKGRLRFLIRSYTGSQDKS